MSSILIADSGSTKCDWCFVHKGKRSYITTMGISPYFLSPAQMEELITKEVFANITPKVSAIYFYGTGMGEKSNIENLKKVFTKIFHAPKISISDDMHGAALSVCGDNKGVVSILGTGSSSCYYNGKKVAKSRLGLGYVLGDEGSGSYFGKKVLQHYLYEIFDEDLSNKFHSQYNLTRGDILNNVYRKQFANRYLATFTMFLAENRGHYMIENIIEDGINDFIHNHIYKFSESWKMPVNFVGSVANGFKDVIQSVCDTSGLELGKIIHKPLDGLVEYHIKK